MRVTSLSLAPVFHQACNIKCKITHNYLAGVRILYSIPQLLNTASLKYLCIISERHVTT